MSARHRNLFFAFALTFALTLALGLELFNLAYTQNGDPDEGVYLSVARLLNHGYPYALIFLDQFSLFPHILALSLRVGGDSLLTGRLTIVLFSAFGLSGLAFLAQLLFRSKSGYAWIAAPLAILFAGANHYYLLPSRYTVLDVPSLALMLWALVTGVRYAFGAARTWLVISAMFFSASLLIKPLLIAMGLALGGWLIVRHIVHSNGRWVIHWQDLALDGVIFGAVGVLTMLPFLNSLNLPEEFQRTVGFHLQQAEVLAAGLNERQNGMISFLAENRGWLGLALVGAAIAVYKYPRHVIPLLIAYFVSALLLLRLPPFPHHYAILVPLLALFAALTVQEGIGTLRRRWRDVLKFLQQPFSNINPRTSAFQAFTFLIASAAAAGIWLHDAPQLARYDYAVLTERFDNRNPVIRFIQRTTNPDDFIISDDPKLVYLSGRLIPPSAVLLSYDSTFEFFDRSVEQVSASARDYSVKAFIVTGAYNDKRQLMDWIATHYPIMRTAGGGPQTIFARIYFRE